MTSVATTPAEYVKNVPDDKRPLVKAIRAEVRRNLPKGFVEGIQYRMLGYYVPHRLYPAGYHCDASEPLPFAHIGAQKHHVGLYLFCIYMDSALQKSFVSAWKKTGCRLDMGKACVRVKSLDETPLEVIGDAIASMSVDDYIEMYDRVRPKK